MRNSGTSSTRDSVPLASSIVAVLLEVPFAVHRKLKSKAALRGQTLRKYMIEVLTKEAGK